MKNGDPKSLDYVDFWLGQLLHGIFSDLTDVDNQPVIPAFFQSIALNITDAQLAEIISSTNWRSLTNRMIY